MLQVTDQAPYPHAQEVVTLPLKLGKLCCALLRALTLRPFSFLTVKVSHAGKSILLHIIDLIFLVLILF